MRTPAGTSGRRARLLRAAEPSSSTALPQGCPAASGPCRTSSPVIAVSPVKLCLATDQSNVSSGCRITPADQCCGCCKTGQSLHCMYGCPQLSDEHQSYVEAHKLDPAQLHAGESPPAYTRPNGHLSAATAAIGQSDYSLTATADAGPAAAGRAGTADLQPLLLLPAPAAAIPENGPTNGVSMEGHRLPSVEDAAQCFSPDAQHAIEPPLLSVPGKARYALPPTQRAASM